MSNFKVYVNEKDYFEPITADWLQDLKNNNQVINQDNYNIRVRKMKNSNYFNMLFATYIATFLSGISLQNLTDEQTPNVIKSLAHFHIYYTVARFMKNPSLMREYITSKVIKAVRSHIPIKYREFESQTTDGDGNYFDILAAVNYSKEDYKSMIPYESNGITEIGRGLFQLSLEVYVRSILGAQADVSKGGSRIFRTLVKNVFAQHQGGRTKPIFPRGTPSEKFVSLFTQSQQIPTLYSPLPVPMVN